MMDSGTSCSGCRGRSFLSVLCKLLALGPVFRPAAVCGHVFHFVCSVMLVGLACSFAQLISSRFVVSLIVLVRFLAWVLIVSAVVASLYCFDRMLLCVLLYLRCRVVCRCGCTVLLYWCHVCVVLCPFCRVCALLRYLKLMCCQYYY